MTYANDPPKLADVFKLPSTNGQEKRQERKQALAEAISGADALETLKLGLETLEDIDSPPSGSLLKTSGSRRGSPTARHSIKPSQRSLMSDATTRTARSLNSWSVNTTPHGGLINSAVRAL